MTVDGLGGDGATHSDVRSHATQVELRWVDGTWAAVGDRRAATWRPEAAKRPEPRSVRYCPCATSDSGANLEE